MPKVCQRIRDTMKGITVVFDIDDTICYKIVEELRDKFDGCIVRDIQVKRGMQYYLFAPGFEDLLKYLLNQGCFIAFFSLGSEKRNTVLLDGYLSDDRVLGSEKYRRLKNEGQFRVYSKQHITDNAKKGLVQLLLPNQTIDDIILVDDDDTSPDSDHGEDTFIQYLHWLPNVTDKWPLCYMYCVLGLFIGYFEISLVTDVSIRQYVGGLDLTRCRQVSGSLFGIREPSRIPRNVHLLMEKGLAEVRKDRPEVFYYPCTVSPI